MKQHFINFVMNNLINSFKKIVFYE